MKMAKDELGMSSFFTRRSSLVTRYSSLCSFVICLILFVLPYSSFVIVTNAATVRLPFQYHRGWWYARVPVNGVSTWQMRVAIPYELPATTHFHVMALPEKDFKTFQGSLNAWPKAWVWHRGSPNLVPLSHAAVVAKVSGLTMRVSPLVLNAAVGPTHSVSWGDGGITLVWQWNEVESRFHYHADAPHVPVSEFVRGGKTPWLDVKALIPVGSLPPDTTAILLAMAPYHQTLGVDHAFTCYPPKDGTGTQAFRPRAVGDYPNDPVLLWSAHHESSAGRWRDDAHAGWGAVFGSIGLNNYPQAELFNQAWLSSAYQFTLWAPKRNRQWDATVDLRRMAFEGGQDILHEWERRLILEEGIQGEAMAAVFPGSLVQAYFRMFQTGKAVNAAPRIKWVDDPSGGSPPSGANYTVPGLENLDLPGVKEWMEDRVGSPSPATLVNWSQSVEVKYPGFTAHLNMWLKRVGDNWAAHHGDGGTLSWFDLFVLAFNEFTFQATPPIRFNWADNHGILSMGILMSSAIGHWMHTPGFADWFEAAAGNAILAMTAWKVEGYGSAPAGPSSSGANLRPPLAWATFLPPVFGQLGALASPELMNLSFAWWRASAGVLARPQTLTLAGRKPDGYPWPGWFPADGTPQDSSPGSWWARYQQVPWARLLKAPVALPFDDPQQWRFASGASSVFSWSQRLPDLTSWPPQPPATRASNDGETYPTMVLPTAAYPLGPIEIKVKP